MEELSTESGIKSSLVEHEITYLTDYRGGGEDGEFTRVWCSFSLCFTCFLITDVIGCICSYPECCGCFINHTCCCFRAQIGYVLTRAENKRFAPCYCEQARSLTSKTYTQCCCYDIRRECTGLCCFQGMAKDLDMLPGSLTIYGNTLFPLLSCCNTVKKIKEDYSKPSAKVCSICLFQTRPGLPAV